MPTRADFEAARPKCPRVSRYIGKPDRRCGLPMRYDDTINMWQCPSCFFSVKGLILAQWVHAPAPLAEAA
jgi:hypothetical protein